MFIGEGYQSVVDVHVSVFVGEGYHGVVVQGSVFIDEG